MTDPTTMSGKRMPLLAILDLPSDLLLRILARLDPKDRLTLSLVSKSFRSIADGFIHILEFKCLPSDSAIHKLLARFASVTRVAIHSPNATRALRAIANSGSKIDSLELYGKQDLHIEIDRLLSLSGMLGLVTCLKLQWFSEFADPNVVEFILMFRSLEELDFCGCFKWSDVGIEKLPFKCPNLRKVKFNHSMCRATSSLYVFANCVKLEHVSFDGCYGIHLLAIWPFLRRAKSLKSLELVKAEELCYHHLKIAKDIPICENLSLISIKGRHTTDAFLLDIAQLRFPLKYLEIKPDPHTEIGYTMTGVSAMLRAFHGLTTLHVCLPRHMLHTHDTQMSQLVKSLPQLKDVYLFSWSALYATLFALIQNCPLLERLNIKAMDSNTRCDVPHEIRKNSSIQCIYLNPWPDTFVTTTLKSICPSLKILSSSI